MNTKPTHMPCHALRSRKHCFQAGLSLVELMVSMAISLVILAALVGMFVNTSTNNREMERANNVIENGSLTIQVVQNDIVHAGFWGSYVPQYDDLAYPDVPDALYLPTAIPDACMILSAGSPWTAADKANLIGVSLESSDDPSICGDASIITDMQPKTDVLVVRHAETCAPDVPGAGCDLNAPTSTGVVYVQASRCLQDPPPGTVADTSPFVLGVDASGSPTIFDLKQRDCTTVAEKRAYVSDLYYVRDYAVTPGDGIPTLVRSSFGYDATANAFKQQPPVPLIEGIQGFTVEFGIDDVSRTGANIVYDDYKSAVSWQDPDTRTTAINRGDGAPDGNFVHCSAATPCDLVQLMNVVAVRLHVLARSRDASRGYVDKKTYSLGGGVTLGPFNDDYKRHEFVTTLRLPDVAGRRETP